MRGIEAFSLTRMSSWLREGAAEKTHEEHSPQKSELVQTAKKQMDKIPLKVNLRTYPLLFHLLAPDPANREHGFGRSFVLYRENVKDILKIPKV